ncbi:unnamed protein product [Euphydryas editha]|uniref:Uncharacterized protein n=1 Tax=Euphydryas editha TaxID=104508 RepID=A0AAU9U8L6_EUPED|nr:unnamed protein product [Euphydryas editha]
MGTYSSKNVDKKEEIIIAQNGAGNNSAAQEKSLQVERDQSLVYVVAVLVAIISIIFLYVTWKKSNKCFTKKIERQAVAVRCENKKWYRTNLRTGQNIED